MNELSTLLWSERDALERLQYKLEVEQLLLTAGRSRWIPRVTQELEAVQRRLREIGLAREVETLSVAEELGISGTEPVTLRQIIEHCPPGPWGEILNSHAHALAALATQIKSIRDANAQMLHASVRAVQETLADPSTRDGTYDPTGATTASPTTHLIDREM